MNPDQVTVHLLHGQLPLKTVNLPFVVAKAVRTVSLNDEPLTFEQQGGRISLSAQIFIRKDQALWSVWNQLMESIPNPRQTYGRILVLLITGSREYQ